MLVIIIIMEEDLELMRHFDLVESTYYCTWNPGSRWLVRPQAWLLLCLSWENLWGVTTHSFQMPVPPFMLPKFLNCMGSDYMYAVMSSLHWTSRSLELYGGYVADPVHWFRTNDVPKQKNNRLAAYHRPQPAAELINNRAARSSQQGGGGRCLVL